MTIHVDHLFIFTATGAPEAELLLDAGVTEGSPNVHPGQGTANRRFFFENGYLELLWVSDEAESRSTLAAPTRLWERWAGRGECASRFGICLSSQSGVNGKLPFSTWSYEPDYLPEGRQILFAEDVPLAEPELFVLNWPHVWSPGPEPTEHASGLQRIRSVSIGVSRPDSVSKTLNAAVEAGFFQIHQSDSHELIVEFSASRETEIRIPELALKLRTQL